MKARYLGHVVFYVKELDRSLAFYRDLLGFQEIGTAFGGSAAALTSGRTHHELLLIEVGDASSDVGARATELNSPKSSALGSAMPPRPEPPQGHRLGLYHIGIKIGDSLDELRAAKRELEQAGVAITGMSDHTVSQSLYLADPDGNEVELYVDADPAIWKANPKAVLAPIKPLRL
jgi:catechol 2,3-dioxygenase